MVKLGDKVLSVDVILKAIGNVDLKELDGYIFQGEGENAKFLSKGINLGIRMSFQFFYTKEDEKRNDYYMKFISVRAVYTKVRTDFEGLKNWSKTIEIREDLNYITLDAKSERRNIWSIVRSLLRRN